MEIDALHDDVSSSEEENEIDPFAQLELRPDGRRDVRHAAVNMVMEMRGVPAMTRVGVRRAMDGAEAVLKLSTQSLKVDVTNYLRRTGQLDDQRAQNLLGKFDSIDPFKGIKSNDGQIAGIKSYYNYVQPEKVFTNERMDHRLVGEGGVYALVPVADSYQYASVIEFLKMVVKKRSILEYVRNRRPTNSTILQGYTDSTEYREHPFFQRYPDAFQIVLYGDGVDPAKMGGPKSGLHEIYHFCVIVLNLPPELLYSGDAIFPVVMANAMDCRGTFAGVLSRFMHEIRQLEEGVRVFVNGEFTTLRGTLVGVKADAKAAHEMLGFIGCGARHFCPQCMISRQELHQGQIAMGAIRTPAMSEEQLRRVAANPDYTTQCGLRYRTVLHDSAYFRAESNNIFDLMHDGPEGVIMMLMRLCCKRWVFTDNLFTVEELNERIASFDYGGQNSRDRPSPNFTEESLQNANVIHSQKMNAAQTLVLFRALPFLLDGIGREGVDEDDEYLQYLLLLSEIWQIGSAPRVDTAVIPYLRRQNEIFRLTWYQLFPEVNATNKFHHFAHLCDNIMAKGPQRQYWCFKEEGKNCPLKRHVVVCNNFKNPQKTAMEQAQIKIAKVWGTDADEITYERKFVQRHLEFVHLSPVRPQLRALGFEDLDEIMVCKSVTVCGFVYRVGEFVLFSKSSENDDGLPRFGKILSIICPEASDHTWFAVQPWKTDGLVERFNAYSVSMLENPPAHLIDRRDLPIHSAISRWRDYTSAEEEVDGESFVALTEETLRSNFPKLNFGQRKACSKLISIILSSIDKYIFKDNETNANQIKNMSPEELSIFLQDECSSILPATVVLLLNEGVDGELFLDLTKDSINTNFPDLCLDQTTAIVDVVARFVPPTPAIDLKQSFKFDNHNVVELPLDDDLGCTAIEGFIDVDGTLKAITGPTAEVLDVVPCMSASFLAKRKGRKNTNNSEHNKKFKHNPENVEPMKILPLLEGTTLGRKVIQFIRCNKSCDRTHQVIMMKILYDHHCADKESPLKYYPLTFSKISMAKGIVTAFPELADTGTDCKWATWLGVVQTKFETVQSNLKPNQKKNQTNSKNPEKKQRKKTTPSEETTPSLSPASSSSSPSAVSEDIIENQISTMNNLMPTAQNQEMIKLALSQTFSYRRNWIIAIQPSTTEILQRFKHLKSFEGNMISEEFRLMEPLHDDLITKFKRATPMILAYAKAMKPKLVEDVSSKFLNDDIKALFLIMKLLTVTLNKNSASPADLQHLKDFKPMIDSIPSSALLQIVPEGTDVEAYVSAETHPIASEQVAAIYPFILWVTNDRKKGMFYLKVDRTTILISREGDMLQALDTFVKCHHVFHLQCHPYLRTTLFEYCDHLLSLKRPCNTVARFVTAFKNFAHV